MAIVKLKDPSMKTPVHLEPGYSIKQGKGTAYISRKPSRRKRRNTTTAGKKETR